MTCKCPTQMGAEDTTAFHVAVTTVSLMLSSHIQGQPLTRCLRETGPDTILTVAAPENLASETLRFLSLLLRA